MKKFRSSKKQAGMTVIELLVVLTLGIIILAFAAARIGGLFGKSEISDEVSNLNTLIVTTKTLRSNGGYGASGTNLVPTLIATNGVPKTMAIVSGAVKNSWDGTVAVASTGAGFSITTPSVPADACIELSNKVSRGGAVSTKINSNAAVTGEISTITATTQCNSATGNTIVYSVNN